MAFIQLRNLNQFGKHTMMLKKIFYFLVLTLLSQPNNLSAMERSRVQEEEAGSFVRTFLAMLIYRHYFL